MSIRGYPLLPAFAHGKMSRLFSVKDELVNDASCTSNCFTEFTDIFERVGF
ncbi:MAG: hypothetical protein RJA70_2764 [Pseudomonadota bacterium]